MGITGKQIRDESVTEADIKDGSIKAAELNIEAISGHTQLNPADPAADKLLILDTSDTPTLKWVFPNHLGISGGGGGLDNIVDDSAPQLGGTLDVQNHSITSLSNSITFHANTSFQNSANPVYNFEGHYDANSGSPIKRGATICLYNGTVADGNRVAFKLDQNHNTNYDIQFPTAAPTANKLLKVNSVDGTGKATMEWADDAGGASPWQEASSMVRLADVNDSVIIGENSTVNTASALTVVKNRTSNMDNLVIGSCNALLWSNTDTGSTGLGFYVNSSLTNTDHTPGAAIVHVDSGAFSYGTLEFKTKNGASDTGDIDTRMMINPQGQVGIGYNVNTKSSPIYDTGAVDIGSLSIHSHNSTDDNGPELNFSRYDASISDDVNLGEINFWGSEDNSTYTKGARIIAQGTDAWTGSVSESELLFQICPTGTNSLQTGLIITGSPAGNTDAFIGIGNNAPASKLDVLTTNGRNKYVATFKNDTSNKSQYRDEYYGIKISAGETTLAADGDIRWITFAKGDGVAVCHGQYNIGIGDDFQIASASDKRVKTGISLSSFNASTFFKDLPIKEFQKIRNGNTGPIERVGFIAQDLEVLMPEMVTEISSSQHDFPVKHIGTSGFIPLLAKAVQELIEKNEALEARILALESS